MTIATLLLTCLIFLIVGWTGNAYYVTALSVGAIVCIAASNGGSTSQDLKTGYILGATPKYLQVAILFGSFASALALGPILLALNDARSSTSRSRRSAPGGPPRRRRRLTTSRAALGAPGAAATRGPTSSGTGATRPGAPPEKYLVDAAGQRGLARRSRDQRDPHAPAGRLRR